MLNTDVIRYFEKKEVFHVLHASHLSKGAEGNLSLNSCLLSKINTNYRITSSGLRQPTLPDAAQTEGKIFSLSTRGQISPTHDFTLIVLTLVPAASSCCDGEGSAGGEQGNVPRERGGSSHGAKRHRIIPNKRFSLYYCF